MVSVELVTRVLCDVLPEQKLDCVYLVAETPDNEESVLLAGLDLWMAGKTERISCLGCQDGCNGYAGSRQWSNLLKSRCNDVIVEPTPWPKGLSANTRTEAEVFVDYARARDWKDIALVAPPFHQLRAFITHVSVALARYPELRVYNYVGRSLPWNETVIHSQGVLRGTRVYLIHSELERIKRYHEKGDLMHPDVALEYLNKRDGIDESRK